MKSQLKRTVASFVALTALAAVSTAQDSFQMHITVDNQYAVYLGTSTSTAGTAIGSDANWTNVETYTGTINPTDFLYVPTASDHSGFQGFLSDFHNLTQNKSIRTGDPNWEVFPAGRYLQQINSNWPTTWPRSLMPTQSQVDQAIAFATTNSLWQAPGTGPGYTNVSTNNPWGRTFPLISTNTDFIWHDSGLDTRSDAPFRGFNHEEFLVFRVAAVPEPTSGIFALSGLLSVLTIRRWA